MTTASTPAVIAVLCCKRFFMTSFFLLLVRRCLTDVVDAACVRRLRFTSSPCRHRAPNASLPSATASETSASSIRPAASGDSLSRGTIATPNESSVNGSREYPVGKCGSGERRNCDDVVRAVDENGELSCSSPDATDEDPRVVDPHRPRNPGLRGECRIEPPGVFGIDPRRSRRKMLEWIGAEDGADRSRLHGAAARGGPRGRRRRSPRASGSTGRKALALGLACDAKRQLRTRFDLSEAADELERDRRPREWDRRARSAGDAAHRRSPRARGSTALADSACCLRSRRDRPSRRRRRAHADDRCPGPRAASRKGRGSAVRSSRGRRARARDRPGYPPRAPRCTTGRGCRGCPADRRGS